MIRTGSGFSQHEDAAEAGREAAAAAVDGLDDVSLVLLFASGAHASRAPYLSVRHK